MGFSADRAKGKGADTPDMHRGSGERKYSVERGGSKNPRKYSEEVARGDHAPPLSRRASTEKFSEDRARGGCDTPPMSQRARGEFTNYSRKRTASPGGSGDIWGGKEGPTRAALAAQKAAKRK